MSERAFVDADVILDLLRRREPFYQYAAKVFTLSDRNAIELMTTPVVFANVFYILRKALGIEKGKELLRKLRLLIRVAPVDQKILDLALNSSFSDFEDALQYFAARETGVSILLTRNVKDYREKGLIVQTPEEYLKSRAE